MMLTTWEAVAIGAALGYVLAMLLHETTVAPPRPEAPAVEPRELVLAARELGIEARVAALEALALGAC